MAAAPRPWYPSYVLLMLAVANVLNAIDRNIVGLLAEAIKQDLRITDTHLGLLTGFVFAVFYVLFGIPLARWSDRGNRRTILALGVAFWSLMTAVFGMATGFTMLLLARIGVGIGEAAAVPTSLSLIADYFPQEKRPRAVSIFHSAVFVGLAATAFVGFFAQAHGWRTAFVVVGMAGVLFALVLRLTVAEPMRGSFDGVSDREQGQPPLGASVRMLLREPVYVLIMVAIAATAMSATSLSAWGPAFLMRVHGLSVAEVASVAGPASGFGGFVGSLAGGFLTVYVVGRTGDRRWTLLIPGIALVLAVPTVLVFLFADSVTLTVAAFGFQAFLWAMKTGPCFAVALGLAPPGMRAFAASLLLITGGVVGNGMGPLLVGLLSDLLGSAFAEHSLRYAMVIAPLAMFAGAVTLLAAARAFAASSYGAGAARIVAR